MSAQRGDAATAECTCGPGAWGTCDTCGVDAWIKHHCPFPCDDVTCEDGSICIGCAHGHHSECRGTVRCPNDQDIRTCQCCGQPAPEAES